MSHKIPSIAPTPSFTIPGDPVAHLSEATLRAMVKTQMACDRLKIDFSSWTSRKEKQQISYVTGFCFTDVAAYLRLMRFYPVAA